GLSAHEFLHRRPAALRGPLVDDLHDEIGVGARGGYVEDDAHGSAYGHGALKHIAAVRQHVGTLGSEALVGRHGGSGTPDRAGRSSMTFTMKSESVPEVDTWRTTPMGPRTVTSL